MAGSDVRATSDVSSVLKDLEKTKNSVNKLAEAHEKLNKRVVRSGTFFDKFSGSIKTFENTTKEFVKVLRDGTSVTRKVTTGTNALGKEIQRETKIRKENLKASEKSIAAIRRERAEKADLQATLRLEQLGRQGVAQIQKEVANLKIPKRATQQEIFDFKNQTSKLQGLVQRTGTAADQVDKIFADLRRGQPEAYANQTLQRIQAQAFNVLKAHKRLGSESSKNLARIRKEAEKLLESEKRVNKGAQTMLVSFQSLVRFGAFRILSTGVFALQNAIRQTIGTASELQIRLSSIRTISTERQLPLEGWAEQLRQISDSWRLDLLDAAEAGYLAVSNQVAKGAQVFPFLESAAKLAATGVATVSESVNLLTSAINAYDLDVTEAENLSAKFFRTVELGRIRISDLADTFGTVAIPASQIGVSVEEVNAALATLTIQGVKPANAMTFLRNVLLKLIQPTEEMKRLFDEIGVSSGEAAVQAFGFGGLLAEIDKRAGGSSTELGKLFSRIRALQGGFGLTGRSIERFNFNLEQISNSTESFADRVGIATESAGFKFDREIKRIRNLFTEDFGQTIITTLSNVSESIGGFADLLDRTLIPAFKGASAIIAVFTVRLIAARIASLSLAAVNPFAAAAVGIGVATALISDFVRENEKLAKKASEDWAKSFQKQASEAVKRTAEIEKTLTRFTSAQIREGAKRLKSVNSEIATLSKQVADELKTSSEEFRKSTETTVENLSSTIKKLNREVAESDKVFEIAGSSINNLQKELDQLTFEAQFNIGDVRGEVLAIEERLRNIRSAAIEAIQRGELGIATELFAEERNLIRRLGKIGKETAKSVNLTQRALSDTIVEQINLLEQGREQAKQRQLKRIEELKRAEVAKNKFVAAQKTLAETELFKILQIRDQEAIKEAVKARGEAVRNIAKDANLLGLSSEQIKRLFSDFEKFGKQAQIRISRLRAQENQKNALENAKFAQAELKRLREEQERLTQSLIPVTAIEDLAERFSKLDFPTFEGSFGTDVFDRKEIQESFKTAQRASKDFITSLSEDSKTARKEIETFIEELEKIEKTLKTGDFSLKGEDLISQFFGSDDPDAAASKLFRSLLNDFNKLKEQSNLDEFDDDFVGARKSLETIEKVIDNINSRVVKTKDENKGNNKVLTLQEQLQKQVLEAQDRIFNSLKNTNLENEKTLKVIEKINLELNKQETQFGIDPGTGEVKEFKPTKIQTLEGEIEVQAIEVRPSLKQELQDNLKIESLINPNALNSFFSNFGQKATEFANNLPFPFGGVTSGIRDNLKKLIDEVTKGEEKTEEFSKLPSKIAGGFNVATNALRTLNSVLNETDKSFSSILSSVLGIAGSIATLAGAPALGAGLTGGGSFLGQAGSVFGFKKGGLVPQHLASGGVAGMHPGEAKGTDTVPAWLTPGEFVMNKEATQKFFPQLKAMNSRARYFADGGAVSNSTSVGDVIVNVTSTGNIRQDAREIGKLIRQEINNGFVPRLG